ncbi:MAG TPA: hypothetical protein VMZ91_02445 [Candidatus Paceibacterota bacterium]|nr:hypothetical protein [Candidatus Paceibacterota bacterium]
MRAYYASGLAITLGIKDRELAERIGEVTCEYETHYGFSRKIFLHIRNSVRNRSLDLEEPGFHIKAVPDNKGIEGVREFHVFLSRKRFRELIDTVDVVEGNGFSSRCFWDRCDINYFPC